MAKYTINHTCGHTSTIALFGKSADRDRRIEWEESRECPECRRAREAVEANEAAKASPLVEVETVELTGTEKQIAWAKTIRAKIIADDACKNIRADMVAVLVKFFATKTESSWWIDNRSSNLASILQANKDAIMALVK